MMSWRRRRHSAYHPCLMQNSRFACEGMLTPPLRLWPTFFVMRSMHHNQHNYAVRCDCSQPVLALRRLLGDKQADALYVVTDPLVSTNRIRINTLALGARLPTIYGFRELVESGGLMCYGPYFPALYRRTAEFVDKILRGTKPADIPVEQPTKFELVINLTTAKALGLDVPPTLLVRADEIIE